LLRRLLAGDSPCFLGTLCETLRIPGKQVKPLNPVADSLKDRTYRAVGAALGRPIDVVIAALPAAIPAGYNSSMPRLATKIRVKVLFFGRLKEIAGQSEESTDVAEGATIEELFARYTSGHPELARYRSSLVASCNQEFAAWSTTLHSGDEVAFLPPVSGG